LRSAIAKGNREGVGEATTTSTSTEKRGPVLEVLRELLIEGRDGEVLNVKCPDRLPEGARFGNNMNAFKGGYRRWPEPPPPTS
jgi:hypothetical protein